MSLTASQVTTFLAHFNANTNTVMFQGNPTQIKDLPNFGEAVNAAADWYNLNASPNYWVWQSNVSRVQVYRTTSDLPSNWVWATYKAQSVTEQGAWTQMFMGDTCDFGALNNRVGVDDIFGGSTPGNAQRTHVFAVARRLSTNIEKVLAVIGGTQSGKTVGNDGVVGNRGKTTSPDSLTYDANVSGLLTGSDIYFARGGT